MILNFEQNFCELVERIQNIQTDASKNKFSDEAPLGEFVKSEEVKSLQVVVYNKFETASEIQSQIINHKNKVAAELHIVFDQLDEVVFTFNEILMAAPNTRDEENYADWYPFKSQVVVYVDFDETKYNLQMKVDKSHIQIVKRNQSAGLAKKDHQLIFALNTSFDNIKIL